MKKTLILMRHGEAKDAAAGENDYERTLTPRGEEIVRAQSARLIEKNLWPDVVLVSSAIRTRQTADLLRIMWEGDMEPMIESRTDLYQSVPADVIKILRAQDPSHTMLMVIGHNPTIHQLTLSLCAPGESKKTKLNVFAPATCVALDFSIRSWSEIGENKGMLAEVIYPTLP